MVWQRILGLFSGADVFSVTIVVSAFMAGLGLGSLGGGHLADRLSRRACLALFAAAELSVGLFALVSKTLYYDVLYERLGAAALSPPALGAVLFAAVLWPTFFMGVSLPLLARGLTPALAAAARTVGSLYGWNTVGAAAGAFVTTWFLLRRFDFETCLWLGAALNFLCAAAVWPLRRALAGGEEVAPERASAPVADPAPGSPVLGLSSWLLVYALSGAIALSLEIAWFRMLGVVVKSTSFTFGSLLAVYLLGVGSGSVVGSRAVERDDGAPATRFLTLQACIPVYAALAVALLVLTVGGHDLLSRYFAATEPLRIDRAVGQLALDPFGVWTKPGPLAVGARLFALLYAGLPLLLIGPPTFLMGLSFPYLQRAVHTDARFLGRRVGWLQSANIAGSLLGSLLTGFWLLPAVGTPGTFRVLAALGLVFAALRLRVAPGAGARRASLALGAAALLAAALLPGSSRFWAPLHGTEPGRILASEDAAGLSVIRPRGEDAHTVMAGGLGLSEFPFGAYGGIHTVLGALPVLAHPAPRRVGVIGLGSGDTSFAAGANPATEEVLTVEIIGSQLDVLQAFRAGRGYVGLDVLFSDPRFRTVVGDGRTLVRRDREGFDVIEADALRPSSAYAGNLYSLEYFALLRASLRPGGFAVTWVPTDRVRDTFVRSFPHVVIVQDVAIGSDAAIGFDSEQILARCRDPRVVAHFGRIGMDIEGMLRRFLAGSPPVVVGPGANRAALVDVNRDLFAKDEFLIDTKPW